MDEFPENFDEFEDMYADEMEVLRELESDAVDNHPAKSQPILNEQRSSQENFNTTSVTAPSLDENNYDDVVKKAEEALRQCDNFRLGAAKRVLPFSEKSEDPENHFAKPKRKKLSTPLIDAPPDLSAEQTQDEIDEMLIERIVSLRQKQTKRAEFNHFSCGTIFNKNNSNVGAKVHRRLPKGDFISLTTCSGKRYYLDLLGQEDFNMQIEAVAEQKHCLALLPEPFQSIKKKAEIELEKLTVRLSTEKLTNTLGVQPTDNSDKNQANDLWVERYKPKGYLDLLSDEATNRTVLKWVKLWDKLVFGVERKKKNNENSGNFNKDKKPNFFNKAAPEVIEEFDGTGKPIQKVILLCGPPGLGKTTLAHIIAKHAGYSTIEMNASDDRSIDTFKKNLENATLMKTVFGNDRLPNCLIIDEIDGAPAPSIELLVRMLTESSNSTKTSQKKKKDVVLKRPVICICNDLYTPALRSLRQIALIVQFPPLYSVRLAERLQEICSKQRLRADLSLLRALCQKTENDIRSCLSALQFIKINSQELRFSDLEGVSIGQKDYQRSLFSVWSDIFTIPRPSRKPMSNPHKSEPTSDFQHSGLATNTSASKAEKSNSNIRFQKTLSTVQSCGEFEKLVLGWFENYPETKVKDGSLNSVVSGLEWAIFTDVVYKEIHHTQSWVLFTYLSYAFVAFHFLFATHQKPKLHFPKKFSDHLSLLNKNRGLLTTLSNGMCPSLFFFSRGNTLLHDILPYMINIIQPSLRSVNVKLYSSKEKAVLNFIVSTMINYNLTYSQDRSPEGHYSFTLEPNVEEIINFTGISKGKPLSYSSRQLVAREIELEKVRVAESYFGGPNKLARSEQKEAKKDVTTTIEPKETVKLNKKKIVLEPNQARDFFGRIISIPSYQPKQSDEDESKKDIWYKFKEGFSNALRRPIKVKEFLR